MVYNSPRIVILWMKQGGNQVSLADRYICICSKFVGKNNLFFPTALLQYIFCESGSYNITFRYRSVNLCPEPHALGSTFWNAFLWSSLGPRLDMLSRCPEPRMETCMGPVPVFFFEVGDSLSLHRESITCLEDHSDSTVGSSEGPTDGSWFQKGDLVRV